MQHTKLSNYQYHCCLIKAVDEKNPWVSKYCNVTLTLRFHVNDDITDCIIQEYQIRIFRIFQQVTDDSDVTRSHKMIFEIDTPVTSE